METSYSNKPYFFVPMAGRANRRRPMNRQDLLAETNYIGKLKITVESVTPLHFGSGQLQYDEGLKDFVYPLLRENGRVALPGSSFKGMLRSVFEAVTESCVLNAPRAWPMKVGNLSACTNNSGLCPACSVFGRLSYKGKLTINSFGTDAETVHLAVPNLEQPFKTYPHPRNGEKGLKTGNERLYYGDFSDMHGVDVARMPKSDFWAKKYEEPNSGGNFYGRKFYKHSDKWRELTGCDDGKLCECLPVGTVLTGMVSYQGLTEDELGALLFALGLGWGQTIYYKLGYAKPAFLGSVKLAVETEPLLRYGEMLTGAEAQKMASGYVENCRQSIAAAIQALKDEWSEVGESMWLPQDGKLGY